METLLVIFGWLAIATFAAIAAMAIFIHPGGAILLAVILLPLLHVIRQHLPDGAPAARLRRGDRP